MRKFTHKYSKFRSRTASSKSDVKPSVFNGWLQSLSNRLPSPIHASKPLQKWECTAQLYQLYQPWLLLYPCCCCVYKSLPRIKVNAQISAHAQVETLPSTRCPNNEPASHKMITRDVKCASLNAPPAVPPVRLVLCTSSCECGLPWDACTLSLYSQLV